MGEDLLFFPGGRDVTAGSPPTEVVAAVSPPPHVGRLTFTARGSEYFRIWIVNLLLTLVTVGVYSAWAKVRKARYFRQNTRLDGHAFDYHGRPVAILRGRLMAVVLLTAYTWTFEFSNTAGVVMVAVLCALGPWLLMRAQQFALSNTSYRGLRFGFRANTGEAYLALAPAIGSSATSAPMPCTATRASASRQASPASIGST